MTDLRYPIGPFQAPGKTTSAQRRQWIETIAATPEKLRRAVAGLSEAQLETPYRPGGWTVRQVVHHLPDSHLNSYVRFKLALTEETPAIKPYWEDRWAELADSKGPIDISLNLLEALHLRWVLLLESLSAEDFQRDFYHPENKAAMRLDTTLALYAWHGEHHVAHITALREWMGWS